MLSNSLELTQMQIQPPNLLPSCGIALSLANDGGQQSGKPHFMDWSSLKDHHGL